MVKHFSILTFFVVVALSICGCSNTTGNQDQSATQAVDASVSVMDILTETRTTQYFTNEAVSEADMRAILEAGQAATSGMNQQSWFFSAIINKSIIQELAANMLMPAGRPPAAAPSANAIPKASFATSPSAITVACPDGEMSAISAGLALENMFIAAASMGYGVKIVAGGVAALNTPEIKARLSIPEGMNIKAILLVGNIDTTIDMTADGVTGPTNRKPFNETATIVK